LGVVWAIVGRREPGGRSGEGLAGNELAIETSSDSSQPWVGVGTQYADRVVVDAVRKTLNIIQHVPLNN